MNDPMTNHIEVLRGLEKEWQEYVDKHDGGYSHVEGVKKCLSELRAALAALGGEGEVQPVAWVIPEDIDNLAWHDGHTTPGIKPYSTDERTQPLYTTPPAKVPEGGEVAVNGDPWGVTITEGNWTGTYEEWKRRHGIAALAHPDFQRQLRAYVAEQMRGLVPEADDPNEYDGDWCNDLKRIAEAEVDFRNETLANIERWEKQK